MTVDHIKDLRVFVQVVDSRNLTAAGRILGLAPAVVSRCLARLERSLGVRLIQRTTRSLSITDEGRTFYRRCRNALAELEAAEAELEPTQNLAAGTVRVVLPTSSVVHGIMHGLTDLLQAHPLLSVQIRLSDQPADLQYGGWDVATHYGTPTDSTHVGRLLCRVAPCFAASPGYVARHGAPDSPDDLSHHSCIRFGADRNQDYWSIVGEDGTTQRVPIGGQLIVEDLVSLYAALRAGHGVGAVPRASLRRAEADGTLVEVLRGSRAASNDLYALIPQGRQRLPRIRVFVDWLAGFMQELFEDDTAFSSARRRSSRAGRGA